MDYPTALASRRSNLAGTPAWAIELRLDRSDRAARAGDVGATPAEMRSRPECPVIGESRLLGERR